LKIKIRFESEIPLSLLSELNELSKSPGAVLCLVAVEGPGLSHENEIVFSAVEVLLEIKGPGDFEKAKLFLDLAAKTIPV